MFTVAVRYLTEAEHPPQRSTASEQILPFD